MTIYLDVSCLNRPFDDQRQVRIRLESDAVTIILERLDRGQWDQVSSAAATIEIGAIKDAERRARVLMLLPEAVANPLELRRSSGRGRSKTK